MSSSTSTLTLKLTKGLIFYDNFKILLGVILLDRLVLFIAVMDRSCATCAKVFGSESDPVVEKSIFVGRDLHCCGRAICARCLNQNKRYETYCPYCQITTTPSALPQGLKDPPAYSTLENTGSTIPHDIDDPPTYSSAAGHELQSEKQLNNEPALDVLHFLSKDDSIHSLSLAYSVPANALRKTNNVYSDGLLQGRRTILIPGEYYKGGVSLSPRPVEGEEEEARKTMVRRWMVGVKCAE